MAKGNSQQKSRTSSSSKVLPKKKSSSTVKRAPHAYNLFVADKMPILCKIEKIDNPTSSRRRPCEIMHDVASLWQAQKVGFRDVSARNFGLLSKIGSYGV